jgi:hypothetical protein
VLAEVLPPTEVQAPSTLDPRAPTALRRIGFVGSTLSVLVWLILVFLLLERQLGLSLTVAILVAVLGSAFFLAIGLWVQRTLGRAFHQRFAKLTVSEQDIRAVRTDDSEVAARWPDPALRIVMRTPPASSSLVSPFLELRVGEQRAYGSVTREGATLIESQASRHGLHIETGPWGKPPETWTAVEIRPKT